MTMMKRAGFIISPQHGGIRLAPARTAEEKRGNKRYIEDLRDARKGWHGESRRHSIAARRRR
jgi:hypothetical protein